VAGIEIRNIRLSFVWAETNLGLLANSQHAPTPFAFLGRRSTFAARFNQIQQNITDPLGLAAPWRVQGKQYFWTYYLQELAAPDQLSGDNAWKMLVPLRGPVPATVSADWLPDSPTLEAFYFPHGPAFVLTVKLQTSFTLEQVVDKAFEIRRSGRYRVTWNAGGNSEVLSLDVLGDKMLGTLRETMLGAGVSPGARSITPFTLVTVVKGTDVDRDTVPPDDGDIHRALEALTAWPPTKMEGHAPTKLADTNVSLPVRSSFSGNVLYGRPRGRTVWFPGLFLPEGGNTHSLACYHRNLLFASLLTEGFGLLMVETARWLRDNRPLAIPHRDCAQRAVGILVRLARLHGNEKAKTYWSWSPRAQLLQNYLNEVNEVRTFFNLPQL
jgi:hypothetical protein